MVDVLNQIEKIPIKNYEGFEILLYFQANALAWHSLMDTGRRHKTSDSKTKDLTHMIVAADVSAFSCGSSLSSNWSKECQVIPAHSVM